MDEKDESDNESNEDETFQLDEEDDEYQFAEESESFNFEDEDFQLTSDDDDDDDDEFDLDEGESPQFVQKINEIIEKAKSGDVKELLMPVLFILVAVGVIGFGFTKLVGVIGGSNDSPQFAKKGAPTTVQTTPSTPSATKAGKPSTATISKPTGSTAVIAGATKSSAKVTPMPTGVGSQGQMMNQQAEFMKKVQDMQASLEQRLQQVENQSAAIHDKIGDIEKQSAQNTSQLNSLSRGMGNIQTQVAELNNTITSLLAAVKKQGTQASVGRPSDFYPARTPSSSPTARQRGSKSDGAYVSDTPERFKQSDKLRFFVQAIIPGRAWLKDNENRIVSVSKGDTVPGFGKVVAIDPRGGFVTMSSGAKFEYGIEQF